MGQAKLKNKKKRKYKWILCTKWFRKEMKPMVLTEEEKTGDKPPNKKPEYDYIPFWTPIGTHLYRTKRSFVGGMPFEYSSCNDAIAELKSILNAQPQNEGLLYVALEVKYVPDRIKAYNKYWFDKYVLKETQLKVEDKTKKQEVFEDREAL